MGGLVGRSHLITFSKSYENLKKLWGLSQMLTELQGAAVDVLHVCRRIPLGGNHDWPKREEQHELPLRTLWGVRLCLEQIQRVCQGAQRLPMGMALDRGLRCTLQILYGPLVISPVHKVHRQFGCGLTYTRAKGLLEPHPNLLMPPRPSAHWDPFVEELLIQGMAEPVASGHCPIRPERSPTGLHQLVLAGQGVTLHLDVFPRLLDARRYGGDRELHASHTRGGQQLLVGGP
jgi:hypothetical protein